MVLKMFYFLCLLLPFQIALNPTETVDLASVRIIIIILFFMWLAKGLKNRKVFIKNNLLSALVFIFICLNVFSILAAKNTEWSLRKIFFLLSIFPVFFVAQGLVRNNKKGIMSIKLLVFGAAIAAALGILQFSMQFIIGLEKVYEIWAENIAPIFLGKNVTFSVLNNPSWLVNISGKTYLRATAFFPDPHMFSFFLGLLIPFSLGLFIYSKKVQYLAGFILMITADFLTFSRGGYLGLLAAALFLLLIFWSKIERKIKIFIFLIGTLFFVAILIPSPISERFFSSFDLKEGSNLGRLVMWKESWEVATENPLLGVGIGNYPLEIRAAADYREPITAHNTYLDIASETGIINAIVWIGILVLAFWGFLKKSKKNILYLFGAVSIVIFSVHSLVESAIYSPLVLTLLLIIISFSNQDSLTHEKKHENN
jgi:O-antigen ligase